MYWAAVAQAVQADAGVKARISTSSLIAFGQGSPLAPGFRSRTRWTSAAPCSISLSMRIVPRDARLARTLHKLLNMRFVLFR